MGSFSKKEYTRYIKEFDAALSNIDTLAKQFREFHFEALDLFEKSFKKEKTAKDLESERALFEKHLEVLQKLKFQSDLLVDEAFKIVRNETALTEKDRAELKKVLQPKRESPTSISVKKKSR